MSEALDGFGAREQRLREEIAGLRARLAASEEALALREGQARLLFEHAPIAVAVFDREMRYLAVSRRFLQDYNLTGREVLGRSYYEVFPRMPEEWKEVHRRCLAGAVESAEEDAFVDAEGREYWQRWEIRPWHRPGGEIGGIVLFSEEITGSKRVQQALLESELRYRTLFEALPQISWVNHPDGTLDTFNRRWMEYTGLGARPDRREWRESFFPGDLERVLTLREAALARGEPYEIEARLRRSDGVFRWHLFRVVPLRNEKGNLFAWLGTGADIDDIRQAGQAAEAANRAKDQFLAVLSHELRTPLTPVLTVTQMLASDPELRPERREWIEMIRRNVELETRLIDDLLDHTRISRGKIELHLSAVDVHEKISQTVAICDSDARGKRIELVTDLRSTSSLVQADPARLQQILWNLVKNGVKFTPEGGTVTVRTADTGDGGLAIEVRDTGVGIDPERLPRIFDAFEQGGRDVTRMFGGLGLGLAISKGLVDLLGGTLTAASAGRDQGAVFTLTFPASAVLSPGEAVDLGAVDPGESAPAARVLLVEDHPDTLVALSQLLELYGYTVRTADTVASALQVAEGERIDVVISDIGLPDGSGLDLMRQLLARRPVQGIALSGFGMEEDLRKSLEAGFLEHLTKPVAFDLLQQALVRVLALPPEA
jgi:PAS domain S-box-containing protein